MSTYGNKGKEKTSSTSEKKEKSRDSYVRMYECDKQLLHSKYERACTEKSVSISTMEEFMAHYKSEFEDIRHHIMVDKESGRYDAD